MHGINELETHGRRVFKNGRRGGCVGGDKGETPLLRGGGFRRFGGAVEMSVIGDELVGVEEGADEEGPCGAGGVVGAGELGGVEFAGGEALVLGGEEL